MRPFALLLVPLLLLGANPQDHPRVPVLVELFTSEGCSDCPPADRLLETLDANQPVPGAAIVALSEHVDYWNHPGWKDPFSSAQWSARQEQYAAHFKLTDIYTPQMVVDGKYQLVGSDRRAAESAIRNAIAVPQIGLSITSAVREADRVTLRIEIPQADRAPRAQLYVAIADERDASRVARGENAGRALSHVAVVRALKQAGAPASRQDITIPLRAGSASRIVAFLQDPASGQVLGVAMRKF